MRSSHNGPCGRRIAHGFTLVELIVSIMLLGLLAVAVVPMLQLPMRAYLDATRRAELSAELDVSASKLRDDLAQALPNSMRVRQVGSNWYLEYLQVRSIGRYRSADAMPAAAPLCPASCTGTGARDSLQFGSPDSCFATLGPLQGATAAAGSDYVVINPLAGTVYTGGASANGWKTRLQGITPVTGGSCVRMTANSFTMPAANRRVYIVAQPVSYVCNPGTGSLTRVWGYAIGATQPVAFGAAPSAPLATHVGACSFAVTPTGPPATPSGHLVSVGLSLTRSAEGIGATESAEARLQFSVREAP
jgi:MSHA biogenesis protein MshO